MPFHVSEVLYSGQSPIICRPENHIMGILRGPSENKRLHDGGLYITSSPSKNFRNTFPNDGFDVSFYGAEVKPRNYLFWMSVFLVEYICADRRCHSMNVDVNWRARKNASHIPRTKIIMQLIKSQRLNSFRL